MIPGKFIFLDRLPLTTNGKIDYKALPQSSGDEKVFIKGESTEEKTLISIFEEVLGVSNISMNDEFYSLGGDSIKAIQIASKLKNLGFMVEVKDILTLTTIKDIADTLIIDEEKEEKFLEVCEGDIPLAPIMKWFFKKRLYNENYYNQYVLLENSKSIEVNLIKAAIRKLVEHHDILREE